MAAGSEDRGDDDYDDGDGQVDRQDLGVGREQGWSDELPAEGQALLLGPVASGDHDRLAVLLQDGLLSGVGEGPTERVFAVLELGPQVLGQLVDDVVGLVGRQEGSDVLEVAIDRHRRGS